MHWQLTAVAVTSFCLCLWLVICFLCITDWLELWLMSTVTVPNASVYVCGCVSRYNIFIQSVSWSSRRVDPRFTTSPPCTHCRLVVSLLPWWSLGRSDHLAALCRSTQGSRHTASSQLSRQSVSLLCPLCRTVWFCFCLGRHLSAYLLVLLVKFWLNFHESFKRMVLWTTQWIESCDFWNRFWYHLGSSFILARWRSCLPNNSIRPADA